MKKTLFIALAIVIASFPVFAQIDSAKIITAIQTGGMIAGTLSSGQWIPGVDNTTTTGIFTAIVSTIIGLIHRFITISKWRKQGKLVDKAS